MAKQEKLITFEKGMTAAPYSDVSPDGELELLNNLEVHAGSIKPAAFMGNQEEAERIDRKVFADGRFTLRFIHTTGSIKHLLVSEEGSNAVYYYDVKNKEANRENAMHRIADFLWDDDTMEAVALGNLITISCSKRDDRYLLWRHDKYTFTVGSVTGEGDEKELVIEDDETLGDIKLRFGINSFMTQFVELGHESITSDKHYATKGGIVDVTCCAPRLSGSHSKAVGNTLEKLMNDLRGKCEGNNQMILPFFVRYVVYNSTDAVVKVSPPVLVTPTSGCPLLVVDFENENDEWGDMFNYKHKKHYGVVGTCTNLNIEAAVGSISNLCVSVVGNEDMEVGGKINKIEIYVTPPLKLYDFTRGYKLQNIPYSFKGEDAIPWRNGRTDDYKYRAWIEDGVRHDYISGKIGDTKIRERCVVNQKAEWLLQLQELMANHLNNDRCHKYPFDLTRDYIASPSVANKINEVIDNALLDSNFKLFKQYTFEQGDKLGDVIKGKYDGRITNPDTPYKEIASSTTFLPSFSGQENDITTGGHLFRYNSRLFKYGHQRKSGNANYTCDELQQKSGRMMTVDVAVDQLFKEDGTGVNWKVYEDGNPILENGGDDPLFVIPDGEDEDDPACYNNASMLTIDVQRSAVRGKMFGYVWYKGDDDKTYIGRVSSGTDDSDTQIYGLHGAPFPFFCYPRHGCTKAVIFQKDTDDVWRKITLQMKSSEFANFSYWSMYGQNVESVEPLSGEPDASSLPEVNTEVVAEKNRVAVSEAYNPYDSGFTEPETTVGTGEVIALAVQKDAISTGQFGTHPMVAFCTDGNYALSLVTEGANIGSIANVDPMSGPLLTNRNSLVTTHLGIYYMSKSGLCLLCGNQHKILSRKLEGKAPSNIVVTEKAVPNMVRQECEVEARNWRVNSLRLEGEELTAYAQEKGITLESAKMADIMACIPHFLPTEGEEVVFWVDDDTSEVASTILDNNFDEVFDKAWMYYVGDGNRPLYACHGIVKTGSPAYYHAPDYVEREVNSPIDTSAVAAIAVLALRYRRDVDGQIAPDIDDVAVEYEYIDEGGGTRTRDGIIIEEGTVDTQYVVRGEILPNTNQSAWWGSGGINLAPIHLHWGAGETERVLRIRMRVMQPDGVNEHGQTRYKSTSMQECQVTLTKDSNSSKVNITRIDVDVMQKGKDVPVDTCCIIKDKVYKLSCNIAEVAGRFDSDATITIYKKDGTTLWSGDPRKLDSKSEDYEPIEFVAEETDPMYYFTYAISGVTMLASDEATAKLFLETVIGDYTIEGRYGLVQSRSEANVTRSVVFSGSGTTVAPASAIATGLIGSVYTLQVDSSVLQHLSADIEVTVTDEAGNEISTTLGELCTNGCDIATTDAGEEAERLFGDVTMATMKFAKDALPSSGDSVIDIPYTITLKTLGGQSWNPPYGQSDDPDIAEEEAAAIAAEQQPKAGTGQLYTPIQEMASGVALKKNEVYDLVIHCSHPVYMLIGSDALYVEAGDHEIRECVSGATWEDTIIRVFPVAMVPDEQTMLDSERGQYAVELKGEDVPDDFSCTVTLTNYKSTWSETSYMKILSNPQVHAVYDEVGQRIFYGVPGEKTFVVFNIETETFSMMTTDYPLRAVINEHPFTYIQFEDYSLMRLDGRMDYIDEKEGGYDGYIVSRPFKMDNFDLKKILEISLVGNFREKQELTLQGTNDVQGEWKTIGRTDRSRVPHVVGRWYKYWRVIMRTHLHETEDITGIRVKFEVRPDGRMR